MHFPTRCLRSESQRAGRAAVTGALGGAAEMDERRHRAHGAWRKGVDGLKRRGFLCRQGILWKNIYGFVLRMVIIRSISAAIIYKQVGYNVERVTPRYEYVILPRSTSNFTQSSTIQIQRSSHPLLLSLALPGLALPFSSCDCLHSPRWLQWCFHRKSPGFLYWLSGEAADWTSSLVPEGVLARSWQHSGSVLDPELPPVSPIRSSWPQLVAVPEIAAV